MGSKARAAAICVATVMVLLVVAAPASAGHGSRHWAAQGALTIENGNNVSGSGWFYGSLDASFDWSASSRVEMVFTNGGGCGAHAGRIESCSGSWYGQNCGGITEWAGCATPYFDGMGHLNAYLVS